MKSDIKHLLTKTYDVIIIGGGPAGTTAAKFAAAGGAEVILFERDPVIGTPVRCGEGISERGLKGYISLKGPWIANKISKVELIAPNSQSVKFESKFIGYILNRNIFDKELGIKAEAQGARIITGADVTGLIKNNDEISGVIVNYSGDEYQVSGKIIIGTDGVEARTGRWGGIKTMTKINNMESAVQVNATNIDISPDVCKFYFGRDVAPGGYLWIFPKDKHNANIGLAVSGKYAKEKSAESYLNKFMTKYFPDAAWDKIIPGGVPCNPKLKNLTKSNLMVAGDAGHQVNPLTGAGIGNALQAGKIAGEVAAEAIRLSTDETIEHSLKQYTKRWYRSRGRYHKSAWRLKEYVMDLDDNKFNSLAGIMNQLPEDEWSLLKIFLLAVRNKPELIIDALKIFRKF